MRRGEAPGKLRTSINLKLTRRNQKRKVSALCYRKTHRQPLGRHWWVSRGPQGTTRGLLTLKHLLTFDMQAPCLSICTESHSVTKSKYLFKNVQQITQLANLYCDILGTGFDKRLKIFVTCDNTTRNTVTQKISHVVYEPEHQTRHLSPHEFLVEISGVTWEELRHDNIIFYSYYYHTS